MPVLSGRIITPSSSDAWTFLLSIMKRLQVGYENYFFSVLP